MVFQSEVKVGAFTIVIRWWLQLRFFVDPPNVLHYELYSWSRIIFSIWYSAARLSG